jgi:hypothetical protein
MQSDRGRYSVGWEASALAPVRVSTSEDHLPNCRSQLPVVMRFRQSLWFRQVFYVTDLRHFESIELDSEASAPALRLAR